MATNSMNMVEIIKAVSAKAGVPQKVCKRVIENFENVVVENVKAGRRVVVRSFGAFYRRDRKAGIGRDVRNGNAQPVEYGPKRQLAFRAIADFMDL